MAKIRTHYDNLKVARNADAEVIKASYRVLTQKWHPDKNQDNLAEAERNTKIIREAYEILSDPIQRKKHDDWIKEQEYSNSNTSDDKNQLNLSNTQLKDHYFDYYFSSFDDCPDFLKQKLIERIRKNNNFSQLIFRVPDNISIFVYLLFACFGSLYLLTVIFNQTTHLDNLFYFVLSLLSLASIYLFLNDCIFEPILSEIGKRIIITPLYIIKTEVINYKDYIKYYPNTKISNITITKYRFSYTLNIFFENNHCVEIDVYLKKTINKIFTTLDNYQINNRQSALNGNLQYFEEHNDLQSITVQNPNIQQLQSKRKIIGWILCLGIGIILHLSFFKSVIMYIQTEKPNPTSKSESYSPSSAISDTINDKMRTIRQPKSRSTNCSDIDISNTVAPLSLPENGSENNYLTEQLYIAPLKIITNSDDVNYFIRIIDANTNQIAKEIFIRNSQIIETKMPLGSYIVKYATGKIWYGDQLDKCMFGKETQHQKADDIFTFERITSSTGYTISGYTIELILQQHENLRTEKLSPENF